MTKNSRLTKKKMTSAKVGKSAQIKIGHQIWPMERDILFRPARLKYVRKLIKSSECVFCLSAKSTPSLETLRVYTTKHCQIILNKFPYNSGHLLVLPLSHIGNIFELSDEVYVDLHNCLKIAMQAVQSIYQPSGFNIGMNHGAAGGAGIPDHLHYHIVPRWNGDLNFFPLIAETKLVVETVEDSYKNFVSYFSKIKTVPKTKGRL